MGALLIPWLPALTLLLAAALQELALPWPGWAALRPDLVLVGLLYWRLYRPDLCGPGLAFFMGLVVDAASGANLGLHPFVHVVQVLVAGWYGNRLRAADFPVLLLALVAMVALGQLVQLGCMALLADFTPRWDILLGRPLATLLVAPLGVAGLIRIHRSWLEGY